MAEKPRRADSFFAGMSCSVYPCHLQFINHYGVQEVNKFFSNPGDCTWDERRKAFAKMVSEFNSKPLYVDDDDDEDEDVDRVQNLEDEDKDVGEEDEDEADRKLFGDTKRAGLVKRLLAPIGDELEQKKPRVAESSCVHGDKTEAAGIKDSSLQA
ncbi:unnamed protein product [Alopecurus aequalis]